MSEGRRKRRGGGGWLGATRVSIALLAVGTGTACFDGASAQGLPCVSDEECGIGQSCEQGFCGGPPGTSSSGNTSLSSTTSADSSTGSSVVCGDGIVDEGEDCDPGGENTMDCDADCTQVVCGDGHLNPMAGELCDDGNDSSIDECTVECLPTLFWDDMEDGPTSAEKWTTDIPEHMGDNGEYSLTEAQGWMRGKVGMAGEGVWRTGQYPDSPGTARLITVPIVFPNNPDPGVVYQLHFRQTLRFDGNNVQDLECGTERFTDGAIVAIIEMGQVAPRQIGPPPGGGMPLADPGNCATKSPFNPNPLFSLSDPPPPVYTGLVGPLLAQQILPLGDVAGKTARIIFEVGFDCDNCWVAPPTDIGDPPAPGWVIDDVVIAPYRQ